MVPVHRFNQLKPKSGYARWNQFLPLKEEIRRKDSFLRERSLE